jgi:hypothetical protein
VTDPILHSGWKAPDAMSPSREQLAFLADSRKGMCLATAAQDASVIGRLIRGDLVRWDDDPSEAVTRRKPPSGTFNLTPLGEACLGKHGAQERLPD